MPKKEVFYDNILENAQKIGYKRPHFKLIIWEMDNGSKELPKILKAAINYKNWLKSNRMEYLEGNLYLASSIKMLLDTS